VDKYIERRKYRRFKYEAIILHDLLTNQNIYTGRKIIIVIPGSKIRGKSKLNGWVVRRNQDGFAVKFDRRSSRNSSGQPDRRILSERRTGMDRRDRDQQERRGKHED
jgi:hypothetical protein